METVPVTVITGFLGAGKSTLVQAWLQELPAGEVAVIVNERGEVGIDGELLATHVARLREITGACVCCAGQAELVRALDDFSRTEPQPRRIIVETSGAASPAGVLGGLAALRKHKRLSLDGVVTVVDATRVETALAFDVGIEQLGFADVVVMSHAEQVASHEAFATLQGRLKRHAPAAVFTEIRYGRGVRRLEELLAARLETLHLVPSRPQHGAIEAVTLVAEGALDEERFITWVEGTLGDVEARLLRVKGIIAIAGLEARLVIQGVGGAIDVQVGAPWLGTAPSSKMVVLGLGLDAAELEKGFLACCIAPTLEA